jgi:ABC-type sugar transport system ATPase subunit
MAPVDFINVRKSFGAVPIIKGVNIEIADGEFVILVGPSGCGKSTLLRMLAGLENITAGEIRIGGRVVNRMPPKERDIAMVFQNYALYPHMTVAENMGFSLLMSGVSKLEIAALVKPAAEILGLTNLLDRYPRQLSGGQQQRVALARGLVFSPDVLLLDEPLGALDKSLREQMQVELKRIHREVGITTVYVTHDQTEAMTMSDRIAVFSHGQLEQIAPPLEVYHRPLTRFVGEFIGDSNFFTGMIDAGRPGWIMLEGVGPVQADAEACRRIGKGAVDVLVRPERVQLAGGGDGAALPNRVPMKITVIVNFGDSVLVMGDARGHPLRMRIAGARPDAVREGATVTVGWGPSDAHLIARAGE